jgi:hypothetical protein
MRRPVTGPRTAAVLLGILLLSMGGFAQRAVLKSLQGKVYGAGDAPLMSAIVYLQDTKTNDIRTFISTQDGAYSFGQIEPNMDYKVWAKFKDAKSSTKTVSSFDSRKLITIDLHIKSGK